MAKHQGYVYKDEAGNKVVTSMVRNLTFENLEYEGKIPSNKIIGWFCIKPCSAMPMDLLPIAKNKPAEYWKCRQCERQITIEERDSVFNIVMENIQETSITSKI